MSDPSERPETGIEALMTTMPAAEIGRMFAEYINESNHQGWDGFSKRDLTGIRNFFRDLLVFHDSTVRENPAHFQTQATSGVRPFTKD